MIISTLSPERILIGVDSSSRAGGTECTPEYAFTRSVLYFVQNHRPWAFRRIHLSEDIMIFTMRDRAYQVYCHKIIEAVHFPPGSDLSIDFHFTNVCGFAID